MPTFSNKGVEGATQAEKLIRFAQSTGVVRASDLEALHVARIVLQRLCHRGVLVRQGRGLYMLAEGVAGEHHTLVEAARRIPHGVVCLLSALRFHRLTSQNPPDVWIAIDRKARLPRVDHPPLQVVRFSGMALTEGIERKELEGIQVPIYSSAKTVADCFKYRNKIGLDVALEALREYMRGGGRVDHLMKYAATCRVARVMQPYVEALV